MKVLMNSIICILDGILKLSICPVFDFTRAYNLPFCTQCLALECLQECLADWHLLFALINPADTSNVHPPHAQPYFYRKFNILRQLCHV